MGATGSGGGEEEGHEKTSVSGCVIIVITH